MISIHLMLLFINFDFFKILSTNLISIHLMLLFISAPGIQRSVHRKFQYISCYCLSYAVKYNTPVVITFQYISCYCLSFCSSRTALEYKDFNTSHVTVYQYRYLIYLVRIDISIHLMLLFILGHTPQS